MAGDQSAQTSVQTANGEIKSFRTKDNMHSEMVAIGEMLKEGQWVLFYSTVQTHGAPIPPQAFRTTQPHCGFCTIMLAVLELPLTEPTHGNYNLAEHSNYPLPPQIQSNNFVFVRLVKKGVYQHTSLKQLLNVFFTTNDWVLEVNPQLLIDDSGVVEKKNVGRRAVITYEEIQDHTTNFRSLWSYIWRCLYEINREIR